MTVCLYLPDGRVGFMFKRPEIANNDAFDAGGMRFDVVEPFERARRQLRRQGRHARRPARRWPTRRRRSPRTRTPSARSRIDYTGVSATCSAASPTSPTRSRARSSPRATTSSSSPATGTITRRRRGVGGRRLRPARPLVGPALLAGALVLPLAHRQLRRATSASWARASPAATATAPAAASCGRTASSTSATTSRSAPTWTGRRHLPPSTSRPRCAPATQEWKVTGKVLEPHPAAQPPRPTALRHPHLRGHDRVDPRGRPRRLRPVASTSTRSSTASPVGLAE